MEETSSPRVALVTGAGRGIGDTVARKLAANGFDIVAHYGPGESVDDLESAIRGLGQRCVLVPGDFRQPDVPEHLVKVAWDTFGSLDLLVNNAGVTSFAEVTAIEGSHLDDLYAINFRAPVLISRGVARRWKDAGRGGVIVSITSVHQERCTDRDAVYGSLKAALSRFTASLGYELSPFGIRALAIAPGLIQRRKPAPDEALTNWYDTVAPAIPVGRVGTGDDIAEAILWLASPQAGFITGITLRVDGGVNLPMARALVEGDLRFF